MCGIFCLVRFAEPGTTSTRALVEGNNLVRHRGPDDEGYLLWRFGAQPEIFAGEETSTASREVHGLRSLPAYADYQVAFGHRRLTILDLSPAGFQPMVDPATGLAIIFNGEIYNYLELRRELASQGYCFTSHTDTEVLLAAWAYWGTECLQHLNGMFAFVLFDPRAGGSLHAVRDRFGVKPLYWAQVGEYLVLASEIKQIRSIPGFSPHLDYGAARDFLALSILDHTEHTFDEGIQQLRGGERASVDLSSKTPNVKITRWYELRPQAWKGSATDAAVRFRELLTDSVRLRLRADVPVGSCLSGGLDSAAIVCLTQELLPKLNGHAKQVTVTSCFNEPRYDEWKFANEVVKQTGATSVRVWPAFEQLQRDLDPHLWHMDDPCGSTSQFSQWCVFSGAAEAGLKVMLSGQGSDEQLAGYGGNYAALMTGLVRRGAGRRAINEAIAFHNEKNTWPVAENLLVLRNLFPMIDGFLPKRFQATATNPEWLKLDGASHLPTNSKSNMPRDLNDSLIRQFLETSLPALLRFEDRISMAWSIESRVPFMDYRLVEFLAGIPDHFKLREGLTKYVMREGLRGVMPEMVLARRDKMGFVTPQKIWLQEVAPDWFRNALNEALDTAPEFFDRDKATAMLDSMIAGKIKFSFAPWRIICFGRWLKMNNTKPSQTPL